jgi:hypothetical protein
MTFEIQIDQQATDQAVKLLSERGFSFMCGTAEHNDDTVIYLYGLIGDVYAAEKLLKL